MPSGPLPASSRRVSSASVAGGGGWAPLRSRLARALAATKIAAKTTPTATSVAVEAVRTHSVSLLIWAARIASAIRGDCPRAAGTVPSVYGLPLRADQRAGGGGDVSVDDPGLVEQLRRGAGRRHLARGEARHRHVRAGADQHLEHGVADAALGPVILDDDEPARRLR